MTTPVSPPILHIVHCVDTEGPLSESLAQLFARLKAMFGIDLPPDLETLRKLQRSEIPLGGGEAAVASALNPQFLDYNDSWPKLEAMLARVMAHGFRKKFADDEGRGWVYNWFCVDHVDYAENPQGRDIGLHAIYDRYRDAIARHGGPDDRIELHFHPHPLNLRANSNATHWFAATPKLFRILAGRIVERNWFPSCNRPGFHVERPDSHWFLEQFIPFDYANQAMAREGDEQADVAGGRFGDWRRAPLSWRPYSPSHDDYQRPGNCRRSIFRCLNVGTRFRCLNEADVRDAFAEAAETGCAVLSISNHDIRDMAPDVEMVARLIAAVRPDFPAVRTRNSDCRTAARAVLELTPPEPLRIKLNLEPGRVCFESSRPLFGPQPFLAIKAKDGRLLHDALDIHEPFKRWSYVFDAHTLPLDAMTAFGVGGSDATGSVAVTVHDPATGVTAHTQW